MRNISYLILEFKMLVGRGLMEMFNNVECRCLFWDKFEKVDIPR